MKTVELMVEEHDNIQRMLKVIQKVCVGVMKGEPVDDGEFREIIGFIREYADAHHHGKEEKFLFPEMVSRMGPIAENLIRHGMLVEHDLGRAHVMELETALDAYQGNPDDENRLDILTEAMGYAHLLYRHTEKENHVVYTFAEDRLDEAVKADLDRRTAAFERDPANAAVREKYLSLLDRLEKKYGLA